MSKPTGTLHPVREDRRPYFDATENCYRLPLAGGREALIDEQDVPQASGRLWLFVPKDGPARHDRPSTALTILARIITHAKPTDRVLFINENCLDCRRINLRLFSHLDSARHRRKCRSKFGRPPTSQFKGVHLRSNGRKWEATIRVDGKLLYLGSYTDEARAAEAYDEAAVKYFKEFARLNFPDAQRVGVTQ